jgi:hypothetical protein
MTKLLFGAILQSAEPILNAKSGRHEQWPVVRKISVERIGRVRGLHVTLNWESAMTGT